MVDSSRDNDTEGVLAGRLEGVSLPDLLWALRGQSKTGVLSLQRAEIEKSIYFDEGRIVFAASSDPDDRLGEMLLRQGVISLDQLEEALANLHHGKRLGTLLVEAGSMTAGNLVGGVLAQVRSIVLDLFGWEEGTYRFVEGELPTEEVITLDMKSNEMLRSGIRQIRSFARIRRSVGPPRTVYGLTEDWREAVEGLSLSEAEEQLIRRFEDAEESIEKLCRDVLLSNFEIYQTLWMLKVQGVIEERDEHGRWTGEAAFQGSLENEGFADIMVRLSRDEETGVLYVRRRSVERSFHFREGRCVFATSSNPDDSLVSYLLMRGVISLRDREETDKRLLSNKRVGTILRELGVIDDHDLGEMVRQQLSEVVFDTFRFADGDYSFVQGDLPSIEEITLDTPAESLVLAGLRRVTSWARVKRGCGGIESRLALTPRYMNVLDHMNAGTEEWQVVTALKTAKSSKEVCRIVRLDDFRICQILWALRVLGAVEPAEPQVAVVPASVESVAGVVEPPRRVDVEELDREPVEAKVELPTPPAPPGMEVDWPAAVEPDSEPVNPPVEAMNGSDEDQAEAAQWQGSDEPDSELPDAKPSRPERPELIAAAEALEAHEAEADEAESREAESREAEAGEAEAQEIEPYEVESEAAESVSRQEQKPEPESTPFVASPGIDERFAAAAQRPFAPELDDDDDGAAPALEQTQIISRDVVEAALSGEAPDDFEPRAPVDATQAIPRDAVDAALNRAEELASSAEPAREAREPDPVDGVEPRESTPFESTAETERAGGAPIWDLEQSTQTVRLARDEVDAVLTPESDANGGAAEPGMGIDGWEPPTDLEAIIAQFNAMQRVVYRTIRAEVGAGAANFIRACCDQGPESVDPLSGAELRSDGSWDTEGLRRAVRDNRITDPRLEYQRLLDREIEVLRGHIGEVRVGELERQIEKVERATADSGHA